jgi:hypothetical protein
MKITLVAQAYQQRRVYDRAMLISKFDEVA